MGEFVLPASPSWYCSRVSDCTDEGLFLFGAKNSVYILDVSVTPVRYVDHFLAHTERVVGVSAARGRAAGDPRRVASAGEDGRVRLWDYTKMPPALQDEHANHKNKLTTLHWSPVDDDIVVSGDDKGGIVVWRMSRGDVKQMTLEKSAVFCLECSPHNRFHIAIGYKSGLVLIVDISGPGVVMQRLRGHDDEVHCVSWCPALGEDIRQRTEDDTFEDAPFVAGCLLATGSRDRTLRVWSSTRGRCLLHQKVGTAASMRRGGYDDQKVRVWLTLLWTGPHELTTSSQSGDLLSWDLRRPGKQKYDVITPSSATRGHQRIVFNLSSPGGATAHTLVSISMDRQVMVWDLRTSDVTVVPTLGGFPYNLSQSPVNPGRLAIGVGDNMIRVWNTVNPNNPYDCQTLWQGLKSKVTTLCWHPFKEGWLAFGTDDGRVGIYDVLSAKPPKISSTYHRKTVYVVAWGPVAVPGGGGDGGDAGTFCVHSCGDGRVLIHHPAHLDRDATDLKDALTPQQGRSVQRSEVSWKQDFSAVALGNEDGSIEVYTVPGFRLSCTLQVHRKLINVIRWHPPFTGEGGQSSQCHNLIATGSNESTVHIFNLEPFLAAETGSAPLVTDSFLRLEGHSNRVTGLAWSPHRNGLLVSASYDGTAQVWKLLPTVTPIANFRGHSGRLFSVAWSTENDDVIYSGADDFCLLTWKISAQPHTTPPTGADKKRKPKSKGKNKGKSIEVARGPEKPEALPEVEDDTSMTSSEVSELQALLDAKRRELTTKSPGGATAEGEEDTSREPNLKTQTQPSFHISPLEVSTEQEPEDRILVKKEIRDHRKKRVKSMFPVFSTAENRRKALLHDDCIHLAHLLYDPQGVAEDGGEHQHLGMYASRRHMYGLVEQEVAHHREQGSHDQQTLFDVWTGDISDTLQMAADRGQLNDWLMALAPSVSPQKWRHLCERYADQLQLEGHVTKAVTFLLSAGKTYEAINLLKQHKLYKEAVSLAKLRLSPYDPVVEELYMAWAEQLSNDVCHEQAAKCYLAAGRPLDAARSLARRVDLSALRAAIEITRLANEEMAFKAYGNKYIQQCQLHADWLGAAEVVAMDPCFKNQRILLLTHEVLVRQLTKLGLYKGQDLENSTSALKVKTTPVESRCEELPKFLLDPMCADPLCPWPMSLVEEEPAVLYLIRTWLRQDAVDLRADTLNSVYLQLSTLRNDQQRQSTGKELLLDLALDITLGALCLLLSNTTMAANWWVATMETCQRTGNADILQGLCRLLLPQGRFSLDQLQQQVIAMKMVVIDDLTASSPLPVSKACMKFRMPSCPDQEDASSEAISSTKHICTVADCLGAFYCIAVLDKWLSDISKPSAMQSQSQQVCQNEDLHVQSSNTETCEDKSRRAMSNGDLKEALSEKPDGDSSLSELPSHEKIYSLCQVLLFDIQVKRNRLMAILERIEKVANEKHYALQSCNGKPASIAENSTEGDVAKETIPERLLSCSTVPILRTVSGEYLNMESGVDSEGLAGEDTPAKGSFDAGSGGEDEVCIMHEPACSDAKKKSLTASQSSSLENPAIKVCHVNNITKDSQPKPDEIHSRLFSEGSEEDVVIDQKYNGEDVSVSILDEEQAWASQQLKEMSAFVTSCPFPDPLESADLLLKFLKQSPEGCSLFKQVYNWAKTNSFLSTHMEMFKKYE